MKLSEYLENKMDKLKIEKMRSIRKDDAAVSMGTLILVPVMAIIAIVVILTLGSAVLPGVFNNTAGVVTTAWGSGAGAIWSSITTFGVLAFLLIIVAVIVVILKMMDA